MFKNSCDAFVSETPFCELLSVTDFDVELNREKEAIDKWFAQIQSSEADDTSCKPCIEEDSIYMPLYQLLNSACSSYQNEQKTNKELNLPDIPNDSFRGMLFLFPFLLNKKPSFYVDADLTCVAVTFHVRKTQKISIATKTPKLLYLSKVGNEEEIRLPFILSSTLKLSTPDYLKHLEKILGYL